VTAKPSSIAARPGEPLLVLMLIVGGWLAMRVMLWQSPFELPQSVAILRAAARPASLVGKAHSAVRDPAADTVAPLAVPGPTDAPMAEPLPAPWLTANTSDMSAQSAIETPPARQIVSQQLLLAAAFAHMELPAEIAAYFVSSSNERSAPALADKSPRPPESTMTRPGGSAARWTGDAWLLLRNGSSGPIAAVVPSYGRSQAGAVLRYRLAPSSGHRPMAYVRTTRALSGPPESEVAAGFAARPLAGVPLRVAGEVRVSDEVAGREVRPAAFAVTELPPAKLPFGLQGEVYAQAGYVGGRYATAFVDGQARIDGRVAHLGRNTELRAGGGVWGGAQMHVGRLDVGPSAAVSFRLGQAQSRIALDYRVRVAGDAAPKSGPGLTISAGF
jgi:hypothetical protein